MKVCARTMNAERRPRATDTATTGSFQNQPDAAVAAPPLKRKRGMSALLQDVTNLEDSDCRTARHKAKSALQSLTTSAASRGNPIKGAKARHSEIDSIPSEPTTLRDAMNSDAMVRNVSKRLDEYIQSNCTYEVQKVIAVKIMLTAVTKWGCSVCEAASRAADCTGFHAENIRRWAFSFFLPASVIPPGRHHRRLHHRRAWFSSWTS